jgi:tRNA (cmo5U34)-methyltransferase
MPPINKLSEAITVGDGLKADRANWRFGGEVAQNFDSHVSKSVPLYHEGHKLVCELSDFFLKPGSLCYEIGCSTGALTEKLAQHTAGKADVRFIGVDVEPDMVEIAKTRGKPYKNVSFVTDDAMQMEMQPCDLIVCYYTVQFIRPSERQKLIDKLYDHLQWGGALIMFEKVRGADARFQDMFARMYDDYKLAQGYSPEEVVSKARSLKGVLEPFSTQGNLDMLGRAGFVDIVSIMKYICFEGFVAIK